MPIRPALPNEPDFGQPLSPVHESAETLQLLALRRSTPVAMLSEPGPAAADIDMMLRLAARVPDHRKLEPWRFILIEGDNRAALGHELAGVQLAANPAASETALTDTRNWALRAPSIVAIVSSPVEDPKKTPVWEQELSAGAVCQNLMIAACAMGWAAVWITEWPAFDAGAARVLGLAPGERIAGFVFLGTAREQPIERQRPSLPAKITRWTPGS
jgi:nitroreductase